jgi:hypothetical protein
VPRYIATHKRPEPAYELHYLSTMSMGLPIGDNKPCYRDCLIFLLCGEFIIKGQGRVIELAARIASRTRLGFGYDHSSYGGRGTERRVPEMHARIKGTNTGREGWTQKGEEES